MGTSRKELWESLYNEKVTSHLIDDDLLALSMLFEITRVQFEEFKLKYAENNMKRKRLEIINSEDKAIVDCSPLGAASSTDNSIVNSSVITMSPVLENKKSNLSLKLAQVRKKLLINSPKRKKRCTKATAIPSFINKKGPILKYVNCEVEEPKPPESKDLLSTKMHSLETKEDLDDTMYFMPSTFIKKDISVPTNVTKTTESPKCTNILEPKNEKADNKCLQVASKMTTVNSKEMKEAEKELYQNLLAAAQPKKPEFPYARDAVRKKADRMKMEGWDCFECKAYFAACETNKENAKERMNKCSRHRYDFDPATFTPAGYWDPIFSPTQQNN